MENQPRLNNFKLNLILTCDIYTWGAWAKSKSLEKKIIQL